MVNRKCCGFSFLGVLVLIFAIFYAALLPAYLNYLIEDAQPKLCSADDISDNFYDERHGYIALYPFDITNAGALLADGGTAQVKPAVRQTGPYVYRSVSSRSDATFDSANGTVTYKTTTHRYEFVPEKSCATCRPDADRPTTLQMPYIGSVLLAGGKDEDLIQKIFDLMIGFSPSLPALYSSTRKASMYPQLLRLWNGLESEDVEVLRASAKELSAVMTTDSTLLTATLDNIEQLDLSGGAYAGILARRSVTGLVEGALSFTAGSSALYEGLKKECARDKTGSLIDPAGCVGKMTIMEAYLKPACDAWEAQVEATTGSKEIAQAAAAETCRQCTAATGFRFCLHRLPGILVASGAPTEVTVHGGCGEHPSGTVVSINGKTARPVGRPEGARPWPTAFDLGRYVIDEAADAGACGAAIRCAPVEGGSGSGMTPGGVSLLGGLATTPTADTLRVYVGSTRRAMTFHQTEEVLEKENGPRVHRYSLKFDNGTSVYPGAVDMTYILQVPSMLSAPNFFGVGSDIADQVEFYEEPKLSDDQKMEAYGSYLDVEPATGRTMYARQRAQVSAAVPKVHLYTGYPSILSLSYPKWFSERFIPVYWQEESQELSEKQLNDFLSLRSAARSMIPVFVGGLVVGMLLLVAGLVSLRRNRDSTQALQGQTKV